MNLLVFSHLRWNFVFQRPQHLMTRCARTHDVFFWEEPVYDSDQPFLEIQTISLRLRVIVPHLPPSLSEPENYRQQQRLLNGLISDHELKSYAVWYYTPMAVNFTRHLQPHTVVYDCMDELSAFRGAPVGLRAAEMELFGKADFV